MEGNSNMEAIGAVSLDDFSSAIDDIHCELV